MVYVTIFSSIDKISNTYKNSKERKNLIKSHSLIKKFEGFLLDLMMSDRSIERATSP